MKFGQLLEYNMRNNAQNVVQKLIPDSFLKNQDRAYHCINCQGFIEFFIVCPSRVLSKYIETKILSTRCGTSLPALFSAWFLKKNTDHVIINLLTDHYLYFLSTGQYVIVLVSQVVTSQILKLTLAFLSSRFPKWPKKSGQKFKYLKNEKRFYDKIKSSFHHL